MQAGLNELVVRREHSEEAAHSVNTEFVSGNYFRAFGLRPAAGRLLQEGDDVRGAPVAAVVRYAVLERGHARDPVVVRGAFFVHNKPGDLFGIAPATLLGALT